jgi:hypothetical protein
MEATIESLILTELQELRNDLKEFRADVSERNAEIATQLAEHETKIRDVCGNGQQGRMADAEDDIAALKRDRWWVFGWASGIAGLATVAWQLVRMHVGF